MQKSENVTIPYEKLEITFKNGNKVIYEKDEWNDYRYTENAVVVIDEKGISAEALDDVIALAKTKISDKVTAEQAIEEIVTKYPSFSGNGGTTGTQTLNNHSSEEIDEAKARKIMGLPAAK